MKLIRFGPPGKENPEILLEDGTRLDVYGFVSDYEEHFSEMMESRGSRLGSRANPLLRPRFPLPSGCPPFARPGKIFRIGLNFRDHARESKMEIPKEPVIFFKSTSSVVGPNDDVVIPKGGQKVSANFTWNGICLLCYGVCFRSDEGFSLAVFRVCYGVCFRSDEGFFSRVPGFNAPFCRSCSRGSIHTVWQTSEIKNQTGHSPFRRYRAAGWASRAQRLRQRRPQRIHH
jgi:hypothetical protein